MAEAPGVKQPMITILPASPDDACEILAIQRRAFEAEARLYRHWDIPPLTETLESVIEEISTARVLKAVAGQRIVGSIRGIASGPVCTVRRLSVDPDRQGRGLGSRLLAAIELCHPQAARFELTTVMDGNIRYYIRRGYHVLRKTAYTSKITLVHMGKSVTEPDSG